MNDLTILFLTNNTGLFLNTQTIANTTIFEPAFIVIN